MRQTGRYNVGTYRGRKGATSVLDFVSTCSSVSVRAQTRMHITWSVLNRVFCGSTLSVRQFVRCGSSLSVKGALYFEKCRTMSLMQNCLIGSSLSFRSGCGRMSKFLSIIDFTTVGSSLSLRNVMRLGSQFSMADWLSLGSTISVRNNARFRSGPSIIEFASLGMIVYVFHEESRTRSHHSCLSNIKQAF